MDLIHNVLERHVDETVPMPEALAARRDTFDCERRTPDARMILLIGRSEDERQGLIQLLSGVGFQVREATSRSDAFLWLKSFRPDLILIDSLACYEDGFVFCRTVTAQTGAPVVVLARVANEVDCVLALENGAADYVDRQGSSVVLVSRLRAAMRHRRDGAVTAAAAKTLTVDAIAQVVRFAGEQVRLSRSEFTIFMALFQRSGQLVTVEALLGLIGDGDDEPSKRALSTRIYRIRGRLLEAGAPKYILKAVWGKGYAMSTEFLPL